jgi:hypothetical protein
VVTVDDRSSTSGPVGATRFGLSYSRPLLALLTPMLAGPRRSGVLVGTDEIVVEMGMGGWAFRAGVPRSSVTAVDHAEGPVQAWGAHGWRHRWLVNGSSRGLVRLKIEPRARGRCLVFPLSVSELTVSLADPDAFIRAVRSSGSG